MFRIDLNKAKFVCLILIVMICAVNAISANIIHKVRIVDLNNDPINHALVRVDNEKIIPVDIEGYFIITNEISNDSKIEILAMGYNSLITKIADLLDAERVTLNEKMGHLGEVVVSATRTDRSVEDLPMPVQVISQKQIKETGGMRLSEVLREQTGLQVVSNHGAGLQMQGLSSDYILILLDGEPLIGRTAGTFDLDRISVSNIEKIEVLRGPSSSIYGSEAMAGVINIITKNTGEKFLGNLETRYRSFNTLDISAEAGINQNNWNVYAYFNHFNTDGYDLRPEIIGQTQAPYQANTAQFKVGKKIDKRWEAKVFSRFYTEDSHNIMESMRQGNLALIDMAGERQDFNINPTLNFKPNDRWSFTLRSMTSRFETLSTSHYQEDRELLDRQDFTQFYHRTELQMDHQLNDKQLMTLGGGHLMETVEATRYDGVNRFDAAYLFLQHQWNPSEKWSVVTGMRGDIHSQYGERLSPKVSGMYKISKKISWQASVGAGFKAPDFRQLLLNFNNASAGYYVFGANLAQEGIARLQEQGLVQQILIDPSLFGELKAEHSWAFNTGFRWKLSDDLLVQSNFFRNHITNLIETAAVARLTSGQNAFSYLNVASVLTQGAEIDLTYRLGYQLQFSLGYMYLDTRDMYVLERIDNGEIFKRDSQNRTVRVTRQDYGGLFNRSRHSGNLKINYQHKPSEINLSTRLIYRGPFGFGDTNGNLILDDPSEYTKAIYSLNITLNKQFSNGLTLEVGGINVTNLQNVNDPTNPGRIIFAGFRLPIHEITKSK
ncbi:TonB-dependent receptor plug domain-containing protein [Belliella marina]|uniref:TonB-dependent receptor plug domain-containing protein n=1 Tax=Belliella marina TaxID=1644146 RepID=A0ABW4VII4_9BACT